MSGVARGADPCRSMDQPPISEFLPLLYREVLDAVADLERNGQRREATLIRADATAAYSKAWNALAAQRLRSLLVRAERISGARRRLWTAPTRDGIAPQRDLERTTA
jgi:hypothetical protein